METNLSVLFRSAAGEEHFLFQVLNIGSQDTDELKFVFTDPNSGTGGLYQATRDRYGSGDLIRLVPEITYHSDGSLLFKFPSYNARTTTEYRNPQQKDFRRTPLHSIDLWEGFLLYRVHSYEFCKKRKSSNPYLIRIDSEWFNGTPFEVRLFLGGKTCPTPIASETILVERVTGISPRLDLLLMFMKLTADGFWARVGNTSEFIFSRTNVVELIPHSGVKP